MYFVSLTREVNSDCKSWTKLINSSLVCIDKFIDEGLEAEFSEGFELDKFEAPKSFSGISMSISKGGLPARWGSKEKIV